VRFLVENGPNCKPIDGLLVYLPQLRKQALITVITIGNCVAPNKPRHSGRIILRGRKYQLDERGQMRFGWSISSLVILLLLACQVTTPASTPFPFTITIPTPEPTLNPVNCSTILCCIGCPSIPVVRIIDSDTFESAQDQRVRLFRVNTPERGQSCFNEVTERLRQLVGRSVGVEFGPRQAD
jgi:hypothetical protein